MPISSRRFFALGLFLSAVLFLFGCSTSSGTPGPSAGSGNAGSGGQATSGSGSGSPAMAGSGSSGSPTPGSGSGAATLDDAGAVSAPGDDASTGMGPESSAPAPGLDGGTVTAGDGAVGWDTVPSILARIVPPTFPALDCDVTKYGGVGDGTTDNTTAFAAAIAACVTAGGGRVVVPPGTFFTGPIELKSNINLYVSAGATIKFTTDPAKYLPVVEVSWEGSLAMNYRPLISAHDAMNIAITGTGTIDGNASMANWYSWRTPEIPDQTKLRGENAMGIPPSQRIYGAGHFLRPSLIEFMRCTNVLFDGFTAQNSPFWTIHPVLCTNVTARNFTSLAPVPNTDGFDPESCTDVLVQNATIKVGDDALAVKAGRDRDGWTYYKPSQNIVVQKSNLISHVGAITIGSEMSAGVRNVYVEDSTFGDATGNLQMGFFIKSAVTRGGFMHDIYARRITVGTVSQSFFVLTGHYQSGAVVGSNMFTDVSNINLDTITVAKSTAAAFSVAGADATKPAVGIHFANVTVTSAPSGLAGGSGHYTGLTATGCTVNGAPFNPPASMP